MPTYPANIPAIHRKNRPIAAVLRMTAAAAGAASTKRTRPWVDRKACHAISAPLNAIAGSNRAIGRITIYISVAACPELDRLMEDVIQTAAMPRTIASATPKDGFRSHQRGRSGRSSASSGSVDAPADLTLCSEDTYTTSHKNCQHRMHNNGLVMRKDSFGAKNSGVATDSGIATDPGVATHLDSAVERGLHEHGQHRGGDARSGRAPRQASVTFHMMATSSLTQVA